ncbi:hypothetical protein YC2023_077017 [Brassica napus]
MVKQTKIGKIWCIFIRWQRMKNSHSTVSTHRYDKLRPRPVFVCMSQVVRLHVARPATCDMRLATCDLRLIAGRMLLFVSLSRNMRPAIGRKSQVAGWPHNQTNIWRLSSSCKNLNMCWEKGNRIQYGTPHKSGANKEESVGIPEEGNIYVCMILYGKRLACDYNIFNIYGNIRFECFCPNKLTDTILH